MLRKIMTVLSLLVILSMVTSPVFARPEAPQGPLPTAMPRNIHNGTVTHQPVPAQSGITAAAADGVVHAQAIAQGKPVTFGYDKTFGKSEEAYIEDSEHLNGPIALTVDGAGSVYIVEENGARLLKYDKDGNFIWQAGKAGLHEWSLTGIGFIRELTFGPDGMLWVADGNSIIRYNPNNGDFLNRFPPIPWEAPAEFQFNDLRGIAFDSADRLYVSDQRNNVVQVYQYSNGNLTYQATIGRPDYQPGSGNNEFNQPGQIAIDSSDNLYVADTQNWMIKQCSAIDDTFTKWNCTTFFGNGTPGGESDQVSMAYGMGYDASTDALYFTDNGNGRVIMCMQPENGINCVPGYFGLNWPTDVAADPTTGNVYIAIYDDYIVSEYTRPMAGDGVFQRIFAGTPGVPYVTDGQHFFGPSGIDVDSKGNIYLAENWGQRLVKLSPTGATLWTHGEAGIPGGWIGDFEDHLSFPSALAVDPSGKRVIVTEGNVVAAFNTLDGSYAGRVDNGNDDNFTFYNAMGVTFDRSGNLYIADEARQRVTVYNKLGAFVRQIGETDVSRPDNAHFNQPNGLVADAKGNLYVADKGNCRVQKFDKTGKFLMTFGTARCGGTYDRMGGPSDVSVDAKGNVYVLENWNNRVSIYDAKGAYLGFVGGGFGPRNSQMRSPLGVALDTKGNVYVADENNGRIQRFTPGVPFAAKISQSNFGMRDNTWIWAMGTFKGQVYAGTTAAGPGAQIWRLTKSGAWEGVMMDSFEDGNNFAIDSLYEYQGFLYASTANCYGPDCSQSNGGQLWRSPDGLTWQPVVWDGFGSTSNTEIYMLATLGKKLCASTWSNGDGAEIWCSASGDPGTWSLDADPGFGDPENYAIPDMLEYNGTLYAGTFHTTEGAHMYRKLPGGNWTQFSFPPQDSSSGINSMAIFQTYLYVITPHAQGTGSDVWRCPAAACDQWTKVAWNGFGNPENRIMPGLEATKSALYAVTSNSSDGLSVWKTTNGTTWTQVSKYGLGTADNMFIYRDNGVISIGTNLYLGVTNLYTGAAVWKICPGAVCK